MKTTDKIPANYESIYRFIESTYSGKSDTHLDIDFIADYSTRMSIVLKFIVRHNDTQDVIYIKREKADHEQGILSREYENSLKFYKYNNDEKFTCAELLAFSGQDNILIFKECQGENFLNLIVNACHWPALFKTTQYTIGAAKSLGQWLQNRESNSLACSSNKQVLEDIQLEVLTIEKTLSKMALREKTMPLFKQCKKILDDNIDHVLNGDNIIYMAHGDFHPGNFFIDSDYKVCAIDFQHVKARILGYDALYFESILRLSFGAARYNPILIKNIMATFYQGYSRNIEISIKQRLVLKALITIRTLVYISSIYKCGNKRSYAISVLDIRKINRWLLN